MGTKKIIIPIAIAVVVACGVGYYCYNTVKASSSSSITTSSSSSSSTEVSSENASTTNTNVSASKAAKGISKSNENLDNETSTGSSSNVIVTTNSNGNSTETTQSTNSGTITYSVPSNMFTSSVVVVKNTTGKAISESQLDEYLRSWIMVGQNGCSSICDADGTYWSEPWLNKVSQETLYQAFVNANGESALYQNITANEFIKATEELDRLTADDVPFTLSQAKALILDMLQEDGYATPSEVTKIVFVQGTPSVYEVYTKESKNDVFWTVYANSGYAHG